MSNFDHVLGVVSQTRLSSGHRTHDAHANSLDYQAFNVKVVNKLNLQTFNN